uniref:Torsin-1A-interacting protein 1/2 AAA+ activator domain-containing protein n=1 Tax=Plectus sambesii TaxID=2011161 RepID=A0A914ULH3_9BILA
MPRPLYPKLPTENVGTSGRGSDYEEQEEQEQEQDKVDDVTEDSSFERILPGRDRYNLRDTLSRDRREPVRPRGSSPSSSSETSFLYTTTHETSRTGGRSNRAQGDSHPYEHWQEMAREYIRELIIIVTALLGMLVYLADPWGTSVQKPLDAMVLYNEGMRHMVSRYGSQDRDSWLVLRTAGRHVFNSSVVQEPAVVLLAGDPSTAACFAQELAAVALSAYGLDPTTYSSTIIKGASYRHSEAAAAKKALDIRLSSTLSKQSVATLLGLDSLPGDSPLMLHTYCDHENAPFKDAFIILSTSVDTDGVVGSRHCDAVVHSALEDRWKNQPGLNKDKIGALLARIGNSVVCLRTQRDITC